MVSTVEEAADESALRLEMLADEVQGLRQLARPALTELWKEADKLAALMVASKKTARRNAG